MFQTAHQRGIYSLSMAASMLCCSRLLILFSFAQRQLVQGIRPTGIKGLMSLHDQELLQKAREGDNAASACSGPRYEARVPLPLPPLSGQPAFAILRLGVGGDTDAHDLANETLSVFFWGPFWAMGAFFKDPPRLRRPLPARTGLETWLLEVGQTPSAFKFWPGRGGGCGGKAIRRRNLLRSCHGTEESRGRGAGGPAVSGAGGECPALSSTVFPSNSKPGRVLP